MATNILSSSRMPSETARERNDYWQACKITLGMASVSGVLGGVAVAAHSQGCALMSLMAGVLMNEEFWSVCRHSKYLAESMKDWSVRQGLSKSSQFMGAHIKRVTAAVLSTIVCMGLGAGVGYQATQVILSGQRIPFLGAQSPEAKENPNAGAYEPRWLDRV